MVEKLILSAERRRLLLTGDHWGVFYPRYLQFRY